jgi:23S rRNA (cytidine1920-2'-O)/16S rRNA (cytidine1409-2'-O)-methyltransferase
MKIRLDQFLVDEGLFESRARAKAAVMEGLVSVDGSAEVKPGTQVCGEEDIVVSDSDTAYVSRGGKKLAHALETFDMDVGGKVIVDIGSSTGGFTDCLLRNGASRVAAIDVGKGQLHWKLRRDSRVTVLEGYNARNLKVEELPFIPDLAVIDVSFISLTRILEPVFRALAGNGEVLALVKPQFEAGRELVEKGGVVRDPLVHLQVLNTMAGWLTERGLVLKAITSSPIKGPKGNIEFFVQVGRNGDPVSRDALEQEVMKAHV